MNCPSCALDMVSLTLEGHLATAITVDVCAACHVFWFDTYESLQLSPASTLTLFTYIGEASAGKKAIPAVVRCPRCESRLVPTHMVRARREVAAAFATLERGDDWWRDASSSGLVEAGVAALVRWLESTK